MFLMVGRHPGKVVATNPDETSRLDSPDFMS